MLHLMFFLLCREQPEPGQQQVWSDSAHIGGVQETDRSSPEVCSGGSNKYREISRNTDTTTVPGDIYQWSITADYLSTNLNGFFLMIGTGAMETRECYRMCVLVMLITISLRVYFKYCSILHSISLWDRSFAQD